MRTHFWKRAVFSEPMWASFFLDNPKKKGFELRQIGGDILRFEIKRNGKWKKREEKKGKRKGRRRRWKEEFSIERRQDALFNLRENHEKIFGWKWERTHVVRVGNSEVRNSELGVDQEGYCPIEHVFFSSSNLLLLIFVDVVPHTNIKKSHVLFITRPCS